MHSKVIIASLVCFLAASFNSGKGIVSDAVKATKETEVTVDHAPNDDQTYFNIFGQDGYAGDQVYADFNHEEPLSALFLSQCSSGVTANVSLSSDGVWSTVYVQVPQGAGDYFVTFSYRYIGDSVTRKKTIYIHSDGVHQYSSALSADDARGNFFYFHVASDEERAFLSYREEYNFGHTVNRVVRNSANRANTKAGLAVTGIQHHLEENIDLPGKKIIIEGPLNPIPIDLFTPTYELTKFDAEKHYVDYVNGDRNDVIIEPTYTQNSSAGNVNVTVNASWFDENNVEHPLKGIKVDLLAPDNTSMIGDAVNFTNNSGVYSATIPLSVASNYQREELQLKLSTVSRATYVENSNYLNYPICYSIKDTTTISYFKKLSRYSNIEFDVKIYAGNSDRANAYEICQAQALPYEYANAFTNGVDTVRTEYPADYSAYFNYRNYIRVVKIQKEDYKSWDLLNHDYSHYICDVLGLCNIPQNDVDHLHNVYEDLIEKYDYYTGPEIAYREGLATYIGIASQMYGAANSNIPGVGDEKYQDTHRNLTVDYSNYSPAGYLMWPQVLRGEAIEANITSFLLKALDNVSRFGDNVALGHAAMWNAITSSPSSYDYYDSICELMAAMINLNPSAADSIRWLAMFENVAEEIVIPIPVAKWTIMLYIEGTDLESGGKNADGTWKDRIAPGAASIDIAEILRVNSKPSDVNIIIETGGAERWRDSRISANHICRFEVGYYNSLNRVATLPNEEMYEEDVFESFLEWGLSQYPAEKTGVILWNHGGGLDGACSINGDTMTNACNTAFSRTGATKLDFIGYDACNCQLQDLADFNSDFYNYMVASQDGEPCDGWAYDQWIGEVYRNNSPETVVTKICDTYIASDVGGSTLSALKLSEMATYKAAFESLAYKLKNLPPASIFGINIPAPSALAIVTVAAGSARSFGYDGDDGMVDGKGLLVGIKAALTTLYGLTSYANIINDVDAVIALFEQVIYHNSTTSSFADSSSGMSIHIAPSGLVYRYDAHLTRFNVWRSIFIQD